MYNNVLYIWVMVMVVVGGGGAQLDSMIVVRYVTQLTPGARTNNRL